MKPNYVYWFCDQCNENLCPKCVIPYHYNVNGNQITLCRTGEEYYENTDLINLPDVVYNSTRVLKFCILDTQGSK